MTTTVMRTTTASCHSTVGRADGTGGKGNYDPGRWFPPTSYLWRAVWQRDAFLDILGRFVHVERRDEGIGQGAAEDVIFPRFHQWDAVRKLEAARPRQRRRADATSSSTRRDRASPTRSPGSPTASSTLHDADDHKVFDKVVVITDRVVLDRQLQDTIYQFEHAPRRRRRRSTRTPRSSPMRSPAEQARIIITTLQKFPFVLEARSTSCRRPATTP